MRLALITDIHEDLASLKEALRLIGKNKIDEIACLGDISGFSAPHYRYFETRNAHECLRLIRENCQTILIGNHDMHAARILPEICPFFKFPNNWYDMDYHDRYELGKDILWFHEEYDLDPLYKQEDIRFLKKCKNAGVVNTNNGRVFLSHYVYPNISGIRRSFYTYADEFKQHFNYTNLLNCTISFVGHSHVKGMFSATSKAFRRHKLMVRELPSRNVCIGVPPITQNGAKSGFLIYDSDANTVQSISI